MDVSTGKDKENMQSSQLKQELEGGATQQDATSTTQPQTLNPNQVQTALQNLNEPQVCLLHYQECFDGLKCDYEMMMILFLII